MWVEDIRLEGVGSVTLALQTWLWSLWGNKTLSEFPELFPM